MKLFGFVFLMWSSLALGGESLPSLDINKHVRLNKLGWRAYETTKLMQGMPLVILESTSDKDLHGFYSKELRTVTNKFKRPKEVLTHFCKQLDSIYKKKQIGQAEKIKIKGHGLCYVELLQNNQKTVQYLYPSNFNFKSGSYRVYAFTFSVDHKDFENKIKNIASFVAGIMK